MAEPRPCEFRFLWVEVSLGRVVTISGTSGTSVAGSFPVPENRRLCLHANDLSWTDSRRIPPRG